MTTGGYGVLGGIAATGENIRYSTAIPAATGIVIHAGNTANARTTNAVYVGGAQRRHCEVLPIVFANPSGILHDKAISIYVAIASDGANLVRLGAPESCALAMRSARPTDLGRRLG